MSAGQPIGPYPEHLNPFPGEAEFKSSAASMNNHSIQPAAHWTQYAKPLAVLLLTSALWLAVGAMTSSTALLIAVGVSCLAGGLLIYRWQKISGADQSVTSRNLSFAAFTPQVSAAVAIAAVAAGVWPVAVVGGGVILGAILLQEYLTK